MRLITIANISNGKDTLGFRLLDVDAKQTKDVPIANVQSVISSGNVQIEGLAIKNKRVEGSNGSIDRLPKLVNGQLIGKSPLIVINQIDDQGYIVSDYKGSLAKLKNIDVVKYAKENGIANGKIVTKEGKEFISSINGKYAIIAGDRPKNNANKKNEIDYSKFKALGCHSIRTGRYGNAFNSTHVFLMEYEDDIVYIKSMNLGELKRDNPSLFDIFEKWCPFKLSKADVEIGGTNFDSIMYSHSNKFLPDYKITEANKDKRLYNVFSYLKNRGSAGYTVEYGITKVNDMDYLLEALYKDKEIVSSEMHEMNNYKQVWYERAYGHVIIDMLTDNRQEVTGLDDIWKITDKYVVGSSNRETREGYTYYTKVIRRSDKKVLYQDRNGSTNYKAYRLIGDRYFVDYSYHKGVLDLDTEKKIEYRLENVCTEFICNLTDTEFTDSKGTHNIKEMPNLSWTGYSDSEFIQKFNGFIPEPRKIGRLDVGGFGGFSTISRSTLDLKNLNNGIFYRAGNKVENIITGATFDIDDVMISWMNKNEKVSIINTKPKDNKHISIIDMLNKDKNVYGLEMSYYGMRFNGDLLSTNFLKEKVVFTAKNVIDVVLNVQDKERLTGKTEIKCNINGKKVTFESDLKYTKFEIASID